MSEFLKDLKSDIPASIGVFLVAIPLCLGIAHASGAPMLSGLISGIIGGIVVGAVSKSPLSVSGPAAGLTAIILSGLDKLGSFESLLMATFLAGLLQLIFYFARWGGISSYFPAAVIKGMLSAIGLILILKQIPHLIGYDVEVMGNDKFALLDGDISDFYQGIIEHDTFELFFHSFQHINIYVALIGVSCLIIAFLWDKHLQSRLKFLPGSLVAIVWGLLLSYILRHTGHLADLSPDHYVSLPDLHLAEIHSQHIIMPNWSALTAGFEVYWVAITIAVVASLESLLCLEAVQKLDPLRRDTRPNCELLAQGAGNTIAGLVGGLPVTSVIVRSSVNTSLGARSKKSAILHGVLILLSILFFTQQINYIPLAALAAVLIQVGYKLVNPKNVIEQSRLGAAQFLPFFITIVSILFTDFLIGVSLGIIASLFFTLRQTYLAPAFSVEHEDKYHKLTLAESVSFMHRPKLIRFFKELEPGSTVEIDGSRNFFLDHDMENTIKEMIEYSESRKISIVYKENKNILTEMNKGERI